VPEADNHKEETTIDEKDDVGSPPHDEEEGSNDTVMERDSKADRKHEPTPGGSAEPDVQFNEKTVTNIEDRPNVENQNVETHHEVTTKASTDVDGDDRRDDAEMKDAVDSEKQT